MTCDTEKGLIMEFLDSGTPKEIRTSLGVYVDWLEDQGRIEAIPMRWVWEYIQVPPRVTFSFFDDRECGDFDEWYISPNTALFGHVRTGPYKDFKLLPREAAFLGEMLIVSQDIVKYECGTISWNCQWSLQLDNDLRCPWKEVSGGVSLFEYDIWIEDRTDKFSRSLREVEEIVRNANRV